MKRIIVPIVSILLVISVQAGLSLIEFTAELIGKNTGEITILTVQITPTEELEVRVTELTEIKDGLEMKTVDDLIPPMILKIEAFATSEGFTAREIEITDGASIIEVRGQVDDKTTDPDTIEVATLVFQVNENTTIKELSNPSQKLSFDDVNVRDFVKVEAFPFGDDLVASTIKVGDPGERFARLAFEGIVSAIDGDQIMVDVDSVSVPIPVLLTGETEIKGDLFVGAKVTVIGHLNLDLMVVADKIIVKKLLHLAPKQIKLRLNDSRQVQVILDEVLDADLVLTIESSDPTVVSVSTDELTIPAGELSAFFMVLSAESIGTATITASSGDLSASAEVEVRDKGVRPTTLAWHPPKLQVKPEKVRTVQLQLSQRASEMTTATLTRAEGPSDLLRSFPAEVTFEPGEKQKEVEIVAGVNEGQGTLVAALPGGEKAELKIQIK